MHIYLHLWQSDGFGKLRWIFTIPILMGEPCHTGVSLFWYTHGSLKIIALWWFPLSVMAFSSVGSLHIKRIWLFYSIVKEHSTVICQSMKIHY